jgi:elongation factor Ts
MISLDQIKELRAISGAGVNNVREALEASGGDMEAAMVYLREKGMAKADKRKDRVAVNGVLGTYIHANHKVVVVVEVGCESDFAAKSEDLLNFANKVALHVAAMNPRYVSEGDIPADYLETEKKTMEDDLQGKPEEVKTKIVAGKLEKLYKDIVLVHQPMFGEDGVTVNDMLNGLVAKIGEKIIITQFHRFAVSEAPISALLTAE